MKNVGSCMSIYTKRVIRSADYNGALPDHTDIDIWESYAKNVLAHIDPDVYGCLVLSDKPDLVDTSRSLGVEVTRAIETESLEASSLFSRYSEECDEGARKRLKERIEECGATLVGDGIMVGPSGKDSFDLVLRSVESKLGKLNCGGYAFMKSYHLFVISDILASEKMLDDALGQMIKMSAPYDVAYERIMVSVPLRNYVFNLHERSWSNNSFLSDEQRRLALLARSEVIDRELEKMS